MKRFLTISIGTTAVILVLLGSDVFSQRTPDKARVFQESLKEETGGNYAGAIKPLLAIYGDQKGDYLVNLRLGWLHYHSGSYEESKRYYAEALAISRNKSVEARLGYTLPLSALNEWDAVEETYRAILELDPLQYTANLRLGQIYLNKGEYDLAKARLEKVQTYYPGAYEPNLSLGWTYYYLGNKKKAAEHLTNALMLSPGDTLATRGLNLLK